MIEEIKLINRSNDDLSEMTGKMDIDYDETGNFLRTTGEEGRNQNLLKLVFTNKLVNGYGVGIKKMLGVKNLTFLRTNLLTNILTGLNKLKTSQLKFNTQYPTYDKQNIISSVLNVYTTRGSNVDMNVNIKLIDLDTEIKNKSKVSETNINVIS